MKLINVFIVIILGLMFTGCDDDSTTAALDCTTLKSNLVTAETNFGAEANAANCDAVTSAGSAFLSGGCVYCDADTEACLEDDSNADTCCDEPTQDDLDELTAMCVLLGGGSSDTDGSSDSATCMSNLMTYTENMSGMEDGSLTQSGCETAYSAFNEYCMASCDDTLGESYTMCSDMEFPESGWTTTEITATCEFLLAFSGN